MSDYTIITTASGRVDYHTPTADEAIMLRQIIDIDGVDEVILSRTDLTNGSGRIIGEELTITDDAWIAVVDALEAHREWTRD